MIRFLSAEVYQYMQSVQAYIGAPITATFLVGIMWRGATSRAAITTLVVGGLAGAGRFVLDILSKAYAMDLGPLNSLVGIPFLNYSVGVFFCCLMMMYGVSKLGERSISSHVAGLTIDWAGREASGAATASDRQLAAISSVVGLAVLVLWFHFR